MFGLQSFQLDPFIRSAQLRLGLFGQRQVVLRVPRAVTTSTIGKLPLQVRGIALFAPNCVADLL